MEKRSKWTLRRFLTGTMDCREASLIFRKDSIKGSTTRAAGCACSTCHVIVHEGLDSCNEATDAELDQLDEAPGVTPKSRLGCQLVPDGTKDIVIEIPDWNKNYAKEAEH
jgi:hypothetical protein